MIMKLIKKLKARIILLGLAISLCLQACGAEKLTAQESFNRTVSGLAGVEDLTFEGKAVIKSSMGSRNEEIVTYQGKLQDYKMLTITASRVPTGSSYVTSHSTGHMSLEGQKGKMKYERGKWRPLAQGHTEGEWMSRINPLEQIRYIGKCNKKITQETGAARGTKLLRIELAPEASQELAKQSLTGQMLTIRSRMEQKGDILYTDDAKVRARLQAVWEKENEELSRLLSNSNVSTVVHLTIDKKTYLPLKLSLEREISATNEGVLSRSEILVSDTRFLEYR